MISKERLETLIKEGATIYEVKYNNINPVSLTNKIRDVYYKNGVIMFEPRPNEKYLHHKYLKNLFETIEEAEWHKEFGCIERTERLVLPTWEEDVRQDILFSASGGIRYVFMNKIKTGYSIEKENPYIIRIQKIGECDNFIDYEYTKENYILACRKAKELFLGEN